MCSKKGWTSTGSRGRTGRQSGCSGAGTNVRRAWPCRMGEENGRTTPSLPTTIRVGPVHACVGAGSPEGRGEVRISQEGACLLGRSGIPVKGLLLRRASEAAAHGGTASGLNPRGKGGAKPNEGPTWVERRESSARWGHARREAWVPFSGAEF